MLPAFEQLILLLLYMAVGFLFGKSGLIKPEQHKALSAMCIYLFLPCTIFNSFSNNFTPEKVSLFLPILIGSLVILFALLIFAHLTAPLLSRKDYERKIYYYSLIVPNYGYMGYAMAEGLFGAEGLMALILFSLPVSAYTYTAGFSLLTKRPLNLKKLINPVNTTMILGLLAGLFSLKLPDVAYMFLTKSAGCMAPVGMLLAGLSVSMYDFKFMFRKPAVYVTCLLRLLVIPLALLFVLRLVTDNGLLIRTALLFYAMPCGMNTIVFPKLVDEDSSTGASLALLSNLLSMATIPICLSLL